MVTTRSRRGANPRRKIGKVYHRSAKSGGRDDWRSPPKIVEPVQRTWGIGLDPCASSHPVYHLAAINLDKARDGLSLPWAPMVRAAGGAVFVNWPYSESRAWAAKVLEEAIAGAPIITLSAARPGAGWYRDIKRRADAVGEVYGRLTFLSGDLPEENGELAKGDSAPFPSAIMGFNLSWRSFFAAFDSIATCEVPR